MPYYTQCHSATNWDEEYCGNQRQLNEGWEFFQQLERKLSGQYRSLSKKLYYATSRLWELIACLAAASLATGGRKTVWCPRWEGREIQTNRRIHSELCRPATTRQRFCASAAAFVASTRPLRSQKPSSVGENILSFLCSERVLPPTRQFPTK